MADSILIRKEEDPDIIKALNKKAQKHDRSTAYVARKLLRQALELKGKKANE
jgi:plasmid stability protein